MRYLVDNQLPIALARQLKAQGIDCVHVLDVGLAQASDTEIWAFAAATERVVISKDEDFLYLAMRPNSTAQLVWVRIGNCRKQDLLASVDRLWTRIEAALSTGERVVELR